MSTLSFHFHGYQPGDIVRWREPDPLRPQTFEERRSPVGLRIGPERIEGTNWTDAVLRTYGRMGSVLQRSSGSASVDIEPQTLAWLLERDPSAYRAIMSAYDQGIAGFVMTPPFHPILPHLHRQKREALFDMMIDFYSPLIQRSRGRPIGLWLPEAAYSRETMDSFRESARRAGVEREAIADSIQTPYLIVDARQFARPPQPGQAWARVESTERLMAVGRDHPLSGEFAFGATTAPEFAASVRSRGSGSLLVANDLESLLANPMQAERFEAIVHTLREGAVQVIPPVPPGDAPPLALVDYSSWSDYDDMLSGGSHRTRAGPGFGVPMDLSRHASIAVDRCPSYGSMPSPWQPSASRPPFGEGPSTCSDRRACSGVPTPCADSRSPTDATGSANTIGPRGSQRARRTSPGPLKTSSEANWTSKSRASSLAAMCSC